VVIVAFDKCTNIILKDKPGPKLCKKRFNIILFGGHPCVNTMVSFPSGQKLPPMKTLTQNRTYPIPAKQPPSGSPR
jgi:hypothetical protein